MAQVAGGDPTAIDGLFERYGDALYRWFAHSVGPDAAEDLVQQTFLHVFRARRDFRDGARFRPWLYAIGANCRRQVQRTRYRRPESPLEDAVEPSVAPRAAGSSERLVHAAMAELSDSGREVLILHWWQGLSFSEIGLVVGASTAAVKVRAHRAYEALRKRLGDEEA